MINIIMKILSNQKTKNPSKYVNCVNNLPEALRSFTLLMKATIDVLIYDSTITIVISFNMFSLREVDPKWLSMWF